MKNKRFLASMLSILMLSSNMGVQAFADTATTNSSFTATSEMIGGGLIVTIPDSVPLAKSDDNFVGTGKVTAQGSTSPENVLSVSTNPKITYKNQYKTDITVDADVTFGTDCVAEWSASELKDNITADPKLGYDVTAKVPFADIKYIGEYKTNILFNIALSTSDAVTTYYMGYNYTDSTNVNYLNQNDIAYDILPQADTVAELKEFSTDREAIEAKGYDKIVESSDANLVIPSTMDGNEVVGVSFDTFFADEDIATYVDDIEVPSSVTGVELSDTTSSASTTVITCENVRTAVNLSKKLPSAAKIRFRFEANGERDYTEFFRYYYSSTYGYIVEGFSEYGYNMLKSYGADSTVEVTLPVTYKGNEVKGFNSGGTYKFSAVLEDPELPSQVWVLPDSYTYCGGFWNDGRINESNPCTKLKGVVLNSGLEQISANAFKYCTGLESIEIPASVTKIGSQAFAHCPNLTSVTFEEGFNGLYSDSMNYNVFMGTGITEVTFPSSMTKLNGTEFGNSSTSITLEKINWNINHDAVEQLYNDNYLSNAGVLVSFADGNYIGVGSSAIPQTAQSDDGINAFISSDVTDNAFNNNEGKAYKHITIQNGVTSIGSKAFYKCTAETISIPDTVTTIGANAFDKTSSNLGTFDLRNVTSLGGSAFKGVTFDKLTVTDDQIQAENIRGTTIKDLYIDYDGSALLAKYSSNECTITNVYFSGSEEEWATFVGSNADNNAPLTGANITCNATMP